MEEVFVTSPNLSPTIRVFRKRVIIRQYIRLRISRPNGRYAHPIRKLMVCDQNSCFILVFALACQKNHAAYPFHPGPDSGR